IELMEIDGLELLPEPEAPPVVRGSIAPPAVPAPVPAAPPPVPRSVREKTPSGAVAVIDEQVFLPTGTAPVLAAKQEEEVSIDDMLADVGGGSSGEDLSSQLDDILDRVDISKPPQAARAANGHGEDDISIE